jgi:transcriptional regulator with XRE-family HTH domain
MSQGQLAEIAGISQPNLSAYERDRRVPTADTLNRLLVACGYELVARAGDATIPCPLVNHRWWPEDDRPARLPDDPPDEPPMVTLHTPMEERLQVMDAVLSAADAFGT